MPDESATQGRLAGAYAPFSTREHPVRSSRKHVYIVDDDSMVRRSLFFALSTAGFEARAFICGADLLEEADSLAPGCVLLDLRMPGRDGMSVLAELGARTRRLPVVIITGHGEVDVAVEAMKAGAADFLEKPFSDAALIETLEEVFASLPERADAERKRVNAASLVATLSPRERDVMEGLIDGQSNKVIANSLSLSVRTVEMHRARMMERLGANSIADVLHLAMLAEVGAPQA
ncbi:response regulator transcription factor [Tsuneonella sp. HG222]